ncbi:hypothetical protein J0A67_05095 [Algoriphagus aestuariicola]|jgi:hypothetical protein|uniref:Uncharacterized protein n=1 Tax=Algoriphagus aestuariicola TaxID=1852016 RepID=A0ABS3BMD7_9BACT|nr:hypothetical protein [Algoriphagus aestuariicola]MBN7800225.1 hypothetical protein [Algoriphagus aestuariicola]
MSKNIEAAREFIQGLTKEKTAYPKDIAKRLIKIYSGKNDKRPRPETFKESSFLFIRSYHGDIGLRPFSNIAFWNSPDINISPINNIGAYTTLLEGGKSYSIRCNLHNRGDLMVPYPKVEFFLTDPTLGFNTSVAQQLGVTQMTGLLLPASNGVAEFIYQVPASEAGHKCLFARTWSFSPLDKPFDLFALDPRIDRHIAQKNLNFVPQASPYMFNVVHQPNALETIEFRPMTAMQVMALQHPGLLDFKILELGKSEALAQIKLELANKESGEFSLKGSRGMWEIKSVSKEGMDLDRQAGILKEMDAIVHSVYSEKSSFSDHKKSLEMFRSMNKTVKKTTLQMTMPGFGLEKGQAVGFEIVNTNQVNGQVKGGITIVVTG